MQLPPSQFTLGQLLKLIAVLAVALAVIRTPFGPLALGVGLVLAGFAMDCARSGSGFRGGVVAGVLSHLWLGAFHRLTHQALFDDPSALTLRWTVGGLMIHALVGAVWGGFVSLPAWMIVSVHRSWSSPAPEDDIADAPAIGRECDRLAVERVGTGEPPS